MSVEAAPTSVKKTTASYRRHQKNIMKDIAKQQSRATNILPHTSFSRLVHEIVNDVTDGDYYVRQDAVKALQAVAEDHVSHLFQQTNRLARYSGRETVGVADMQLVNSMIGEAHLQRPSELGQ